MIETAKKELEALLQFIKPGFDDFSSFMQSWADSKGFLHAIPCNDPRKFRIIEFGFTIDLNGTLDLIVSTEMVTSGFLNERFLTKSLDHVDFLFLNSSYRLTNPDHS